MLWFRKIGMKLDSLFNETSKPVSFCNIFLFSDDWRRARGPRHHRGPWRSSVQRSWDFLRHDCAARVARNRRRTPPHATEHHILGCRQTRTNYAMAAAFFLYRSQLPAPVIQYIYGTVFFLGFFKS